MCTHMWRTEDKFVCPSSGSIYLRVLRQVLSLAWSSLEWLASEPPELAVSTAAALFYQHKKTLVCFYVGSGKRTQVIMLVWQALYNSF